MLDPLEKHLPLLDLTVDFFPNADLSNVLIICVQHLFATTYSMFSHMFRLGLKPQNLFVFGKCYSVDPRVYKQLKRKGVNVCSSSFYFNSHSSYDDDFKRNLETKLQHIANTLPLESFDRIILIGDGGCLLDCANYIFPSHLNIIGVEQTAAGYNRLQNKQLFFPVVNVAKCRIKQQHESPIIIKLAIKKIREKISILGNTPKKILIMGQGTLGQRIFQELHKDFHVETYDQNPERSSIAAYMLNDRLVDFDLIIGATGETSLKQEQFSFLKPSVVLASVSSSDREFDAAHLRKHLPPTCNCHASLKFNDISLLNCGFPINFDHDFAAIDTDNFQL